MKKSFILLVSCVVFLIGCCNFNNSNSNQSKKILDKQSLNEIKNNLSDKSLKSGENVDYDKLRKKANAAEAASMIGYDGKALKKDLNKIIDEREKMDKQLKDLDL